ncbi:MAG: hypothetical protein MZU95_08815 [Desulfomicrobium escambiense]|nr:hypothetical protein [Desulfomicrobium escambiense]
MPQPGRALVTARPVGLPARTDAWAPPACGACLEACPGVPRAPARPGLPKARHPRFRGVHGLRPLRGSLPRRSPAGLGIRSLASKMSCLRAWEDEPFYDESGGGVTFTGGEPLSQPGFLLECLAAFEVRGYPRTAVDTCGYAPSGIVETAAAMTDLFLYDLKLMDSREHERWTGVPNDQDTREPPSSGRGGSSIWVRIPLIPGVNDAERKPGDSGRVSYRLHRIFPAVSGARGAFDPDPSLPRFRPAQVCPARAATTPSTASRPERTRARGSRAKYFRRPGHFRSGLEDDMSERIRELREESFTARPSVSAERARILTDVYRRQRGNGRCSRPSGPGFSRELCERKTVYLDPRELIVGERGPRTQGLPDLSRADLPFRRGPARSCDPGP